MIIVIYYVATCQFHSNCPNMQYQCFTVLSLVHGLQIVLKLALNAISMFYFTKSSAWYCGPLKDR